MTKARITTSDNRPQRAIIGAVKLVVDASTRFIIAPGPRADNTYSPSTRPIMAIAIFPIFILHHPQVTYFKMSMTKAKTPRRPRRPQRAMLAAPHPVVFAAATDVSAAGARLART